MKKCLVLDLDNTLWGGVIGEDGIDGIKLDLSLEGSNFIAFQQALLDLNNKGVILAINSKNNYEDALGVIRNHPNMILKEHHFAAWRINWNDKAVNMRELARELNIGLDAMVFFDDDPMNRALVKAALPQVEVPEMPKDPAHYVKFLLSLQCFENKALTDEDKMRGNFYVTERLRKETEKRYGSRENYLKELSLELHCYEDDSSCAARLSQLTGKTNQFNTNKRFFTEEQIINYVNLREYVVFYGRAQDRFGDCGVIAFSLVRKGKLAWHIEDLLLSCRVLGRGIEEAFLHFIADRAKSAGIEDIFIEFRETEKNAPAKEFVKKYFKQDYFISKNLTKPLWVDIKAYEQV